MRPNRVKIMVKIKTNGSLDNIYIDADTIQDAYQKAGILSDDVELTQEVRLPGLVEHFYSNGNSIKYIRL